MHHAIENATSHTLGHPGDSSTRYKTDLLCSANDYSMRHQAEGMPMTLGVNNCCGRDAAVRCDKHARLLGTDAAPHHGTVLTCAINGRVQVLWRHTHSTWREQCSLNRTRESPAPEDVIQHKPSQTGFEVQLNSATWLYIGREVARSGKRTYVLATGRELARVRLAVSMVHYAAQSLQLCRG